MLKNDRKPEIRFAGFNDEWEQRKLGELTSEFQSGKFIAAADIEESGEYPVYGGNGLRGYTDRYNHDGEFAIIGRQGALCGNVNKCSGKAYFTEHAVAVKANDDNDTDFLFHMLGRMNLGQYSDQSAQPGLAVGKLLSLSSMAPRLEEQKKIGEYFTHFDRLITLHQQKCDKLKQFKQIMLKKMFPQNGANIPEIRFSGFTDVWEQRKLETVATFSKGSGYSKGDLQENGTPIILYGRLYTKYETCISEVDTFVCEKRGSVYSNGGEVIVPASGETAEDIARASTVENKGILLGGDLNVILPNESIDSAFLALSISNGAAHKELANKAQGKSVVHIHNAEIQALSILFPSKPEQSQISGYFAQLDHLITLYQKKVAQLKTFKKACLEKMFV